jgi:uncharacterized protein
MSELEQDRPFPVASPCIGVCQVSGESGFCLGCWRTLKEIVSWGRLDDGEKRGVVELLRQRQRDAGVDRRRVTRRQRLRDGAPGD